MKNKTFLHSVQCALNGLFAAIKSEKNFIIYFLHILVTLPINILLGFSYIEFLIYAITICGVFAAECINTAFEKVCDFLTEEYNEKIKIIKDIAAGTVCCWGIAFYLAEVVMIVIHVIKYI